MRGYSNHIQRVCYCPEYLNNISIHTYIYIGKTYCKTNKYTNGK